MITLVLGGARSGKSRYAESLVAQAKASDSARSHSTSNKQAVYIATAQALDDEMKQRIAHHQNDREQSQLKWQTIESPLSLAQTLAAHDGENKLILVDCLSLWLTNELLATPSDWHSAKAELLAYLPKLKGELVLVSNEVGMGIVPMGEINRRFVDESGWLHQDIAALAQRVVLVTAGIAQILKNEVSSVMNTSSKDVQ